MCGAAAAMKATRQALRAHQGGEDRPDSSSTAPAEPICRIHRPQRDGQPAEDRRHQEIADEVQRPRRVPGPARSGNGAMPGTWPSGQRRKRPTMRTGSAGLATPARSRREPARRRGEGGSGVAATPRRGGRRPPGCPECTQRNPRTRRVLLPGSGAAGPCTPANPLRARGKWLGPSSKGRDNLSGRRAL